MSVFIRLIRVRFLVSESMQNASDLPAGAGQTSISLRDVHV